MTVLLTPDEITNRINNSTPAPVNPAAAFRYFKPLTEAAGEWVDWAEHPERRVYTGIKELDAAMRGTAPGEMTMIIGFAQSGKTVVTTQMILNNADRKIAMFTPDETRVLVLIKLASIVHGVSAEELERRVGMGDPTAEALVHETARDRFPNLAVFDQSLTLHQMDVALDEAEDHWESPPDLVIFDYVDLLADGGDDGGTVGKINSLKAWGRKRNAPLFAIHQSSRTKGAGGSKVTLDSGGYGGEQQATHMIGVRRKRSQIAARIEELEEKLATAYNPKPEWADQLDSARADLRRHADTVTISLVKNKRPPGRLVDDIDFNLDQDTGSVTPMNMGRAPQWGPDDEYEQEQF